MSALFFFSPYDVINDLLSSLIVFIIDSAGLPFYKIIIVIVMIIIQEKKEQEKRVEICSFLFHNDKTSKVIYSVDLLLF